MRRFYGDKQLKQWLLRSTEGQAMIEEVLSEMGPPKHVLAVQRANCVEIYSPPTIHVKVVTRIDGGSPTADQLTDQHIDVSLPYIYRDLYEPRNLRAVTRQRRITPQEAEWWQCFEGNSQLLDEVKQT